MVYVIEGDIILVSRAILETLGCIPKNFPQVGQFLNDDDEALTGRAFAVNPDPIGLRSDGTKNPNIPEAVSRIVDKSKHVEPSANAAVAGQTSYKASKMAGTRADPLEVAREIFKKEDVTTAAVRQPKGECDPESDLPCSCHGQQQEGAGGVHQEPLQGWGFQHLQEATLANHCRATHENPHTT
jgi:hypothetical protein